jgi:prepilin-type N-terminal cleavage/methylation domain-containing protein
MNHHEIPMKSRGFTLVELLVVLAVIGTLAGIGIPLGRSMVAKSKAAACLGQLRSLGVALEAYLQDHQQVLPRLKAGRTSKTEEGPVLEVVLLPYVESPDAFQCPQDSREFERSGSSYLWNFTQNDRRITDLYFYDIGKDRPDQIPLITDKEAWHPDGTNFLYADQTSSNKVRFAAGNQ